MKTLIKWPGGKTREFHNIKSHIPNFNRYIEPFFGGGAIYFRLMPSMSIVNDISEDLIDFYRFITDAKHKVSFRDEMYSYVILWERIGKTFEYTKDNFNSSFLIYSKNKEMEQTLIRKIDKDILGFLKVLFTSFPVSEIVNQENLFRQIHENIISKIQRMHKIAMENGGISQADAYDNLETAIRSGFYMHFRDLLNQKKTFNVSSEKYIANYYFIREFCYGSMFRFSPISGFNIPYGGIAYNKKNFRAKVDAIFSQAVQNQLKSTVFYNQDFEEFLNTINLRASDFVFVDPPYDTDFSDYDQNKFGKSDQIRLANLLLRTNANFLLVIKNTPFVLSLYENQPKIHILNFWKKYSYNMKGRNNRDTEHLIITNYQI